MAHDDIDDNEDENTETDPQRVIDALRRLRNSNEGASFDDVFTLYFANDQYDVQLIPQEVIDAVLAECAMERDVYNGGMDQVAWNHGVEQTRKFAEAFQAVGAIENGDLLARLATSLEEYFGTHGEAKINADLTYHFITWRKSVGGPDFGIPEPADELAEPLLEFVIEHASSLPDPDGPLPKKPVNTN